MVVKQFFSNTFPENCYAGITKDGIFLVDPGAYTPELEEFVLQNAETIKFILLTHRHADHICGTAAVKKACPHAQIVIHSLDAVGLTDRVASLALMLGLEQELVSPDLLCEDGSVIQMGEVCIEVLHTPGHSAGSVCYRVGDSIFCGDTLFRQSCGRTDFPTGDPAAMYASLKRLSSLSGEITLYPGHDRITTLCEERQYNPYLLEF